MPPRTDSTPAASPAPFSGLGQGAPVSALTTSSGGTRSAVGGAPHASPWLVPGEGSAPIVPIVALSIGAHVLVALALGALGVAPALALQTETFVELAVSVPPEPAAAPEPPPPPEPTVAPPPVRERPRPVVEAPPPEREPEPVAAPPSLDEVFGDDPAPAAETMTAEGAGAGFAVDPGVPGGVPGGRAGGTGEGTGSLGAAAPAAPAGPSEADRRRARRAYVRSLEGLLNGRVRYPRALERAGVGGRVELCIRVSDAGQVLGTRVCSSAGHDQLDEAALDAAGELDRVPAPPALAAWSPSDEIHAGVVFAIR